MPKDQMKNPRLKPLRNSTSQPEFRSLSKRKDWDASSPLYSVIRTEYNAANDPNCTYTQSDTFLEHMKNQPLLNKIAPDIKMSKSMNIELNSSMKNMDRPPSAPVPDPVPKHQVQNVSFLASGMTLSLEPRENVAESQAELSVLKAILNREGDLLTLAAAVKKVQLRFKTEVCDLIDVVRASSLEVVESIEKWRTLKVS
jgi:hypothetical protein